MLNFFIENSKYLGTKYATLKIDELKLDDKYNPGHKLTYKKHDLTLILSKKGTDKGIDGIKVKYRFKGHDIKYKTTSGGGKITFKTSSLKKGSYDFEIRVSKSKYDFGTKGKKSTVIKIE